MCSDVQMSASAISAISAKNIVSLCDKKNESVLSCAYVQLVQVGAIVKLAVSILHSIIEHKYNLIKSN